MDQRLLSLMRYVLWRLRCCRKSLRNRWTRTLTSMRKVRPLLARSIERLITIFWHHATIYCSISLLSVRSQLLQRCSLLLCFSLSARRQMLHYGFSFDLQMPLRFGFTVALRQILRLCSFVSYPSTTWFFWLMFLMLLTSFLGRLFCNGCYLVINHSNESTGRCMAWRDIRHSKVELWLWSKKQDEVEYEKIWSGSKWKGRKD